MSGVHMESVEVDGDAFMQRHNDAEEAGGGQEAEGRVHVVVEVGGQPVELHIRVLPSLGDHLLQARLDAHVLQDLLRGVLSKPKISGICYPQRRPAASVRLKSDGGRGVEANDSIVAVYLLAILVHEQDARGSHHSTGPEH
eukprot:CAMPEP_0196578352 /NCGR_PEP_ID=MMETSP1081-20130531/7259_1 /TAXON_ID=36882 /ORGANISM="Pyramimonas amylifera, Strain CCMP720" /LENGTH=140 /DNA_ID=CAMNT_0041897547 /DNA_START=470 /DNA_END=892 /DNA_ORIENTATION=+